jgi:hypothetical protein
MKYVDREAIKFKKLRKKAIHLDRRVDPSDQTVWHKWQGANYGPIFYSADKDPTGQWTVPYIFQDESNPIRGQNDSPVLTSHTTATSMPARKESRHNFEDLDRKSVSSSPQRSSHSSSSRHSVPYVTDNDKINRTGSNLEYEGSVASIHLFNEPSHHSFHGSRTSLHESSSIKSSEKQAYHSFFDPEKADGTIDFERMYARAQG